MAASAEPAQLSSSVQNPDGSEESLVFQNLLTGDVWVCSGQSNMEWAVSLCNDAEQEIAAADYPEIRLFSVPRSMPEEPATTIDPNPWLVCSPKAVTQSVNGYPLGFSAVGYYFGRELFQNLRIPIGLIHNAVGGTPAEAWTSRETLLASPGLRGIWENYERDIPSLTLLRKAWQDEMDAIAIRTRDTHNAGFDLGYAARKEPSGELVDISLPANWTKGDFDFHGIIWFRKTVEIPEAWKGKPLQLSIGAVDKSDTTYFNGVKVGSLSMAEREDAWCTQRVYDVPGSLVSSGENTIAVRVHGDKFDAGMMGPASVMLLSCPSDPSTPPIPLAGTWRAIVEANYGLVTLREQPLGPGNFNTPCGLFNGMVSPLTSFAVHGVVWYQGESNVDRAVQYQELFPAMIQDWRQHWGIEDLPFHFVQIANFMEEKNEPGESRWAELREAQTMTLRLPHTGMAVAIDIGDANDIHPKNKQDVGRRLAASVLHDVYGKKDIVPSGPIFRDVKRAGHAIRIQFDHTANGLASRGEKLKGFALAGEDGIFLWADAKIDNVNVIVSHPKIPSPRYVRYAWADNPACNLYNSAGLPASPFRAKVAD